MKVPLADLPAQHAALAPALEAAVRRVLASGQLILGDEVSGFERELATTCGRAHAVGVSSGSDAVLAALMALGVGPGAEVVTTPLSFFATAGAIARLGARPVFADVEADSLNLDPEAALARVTPRTRAILPVHLFGRLARTQPLHAAGVAVVEDAAQAIGAPRLGAGAAAAALSFFPTKNLGAAGDAGAVITDDAELAERLRLLRAHGARPKYWHLVVGGNFRLDALQAAILRVKLPHLAAWTAARRRNAARYAELLAATPLALPAPDDAHVWHHYVVRVPGGRRDALRAFLAARDIASEVYYPTALHQQPCFADLGYRAGDFPVAERATAEVLALPVHPELSLAQQEAVAQAVRAFFCGAA